MDENSYASMSTAILSFALDNLAVMQGSPLKAPTWWHIIRGRAKRTAKSEYRYIKLYRSTFYGIGQQPSNHALMYDTIYKSDAIEGSVSSASYASGATDNHSKNLSNKVIPNTLAMVSYPEDQDCLLRLHVYYSSNLTGGEEILLAGISFSLQAALASGGRFAIKEPMFSEHCNSPSACIFIVPKLNPEKLTSSSFSVRNQINSEPMLASYAFYGSEDDRASIYLSDQKDSSYFVTNPKVVCEEFTFEPRLSSKVSLQYLKAARKEWLNAINAWEQRLILEKRRQGWYEDDNEAFNNGWNQLRVNVIGAFIDLHEKEQQYSQDGGQSMFRWIPVGSMKKNELRSFKDIKSNPVIDQEPSLRANYDRSRSPLNEQICSKIEISAETINDVNFCRKFGSTNTEYFTAVPLYGSNLNSDTVTKPDREFSFYGAATVESEEITYEVESRRPEFNIKNEYSLTSQRHTVTAYIPQFNEISVKLNLQVRSESKKDFTNVGDCEIPVGDYTTWNRTSMRRGTVCEHDKLVYKEVELRRDGLYRGTAKILCRVTIRTPDKMVDKTKSVPYDMHYVVNTSVHNEKAAENGKMDPNAILSSCYSWTNICGKRFVDPLVVSDADGSRKENSTLASFGSIFSSEKTEHSTRVDIHYSVDWIKQHIELLKSVIGDDVHDRLVDRKYSFPFGMKSESDKEKEKSSDSPISFDTVISECERRWKSDICFRSSVQKKDRELQGLPLDLLIQAMSFRTLNSDGVVENKVDVLSGLTCGAITDHATKSKQGGMFNIKETMIKDMSKLEENKQAILAYNSGRNTLEFLSTQSDYQSMLNKARDMVQFIETSTVKFCHRSTLCLSQGLSIVVNGLIMKLSQVAGGSVSSSAAEDWAKYGMLVIFEGLLSVTGKERTMLEDTFQAIETLRLFSARIVETQDSEVDVTFENRTAVIYLPKKSMDLLPAVYRNAGSAGVKIKFVTVLFTQGIDLQQTFALNRQGKSTGDGGYRSASELQREFNERSLNVLNTYCHLRPFNGKVLEKAQTIAFLGDTEVHYLAHPMYKSLQERSIAVKNVEVLEILEDLALQLDALRVTFCKSGKDRTGMAVTLEQSRYMAKKYDIGKYDKDVIIHNANIMREYGTRLDVVEKNINKRCYAINAIQANFLPESYKPPQRVLEDLIRNDGDNT